MRILNQLLQLFSFYHKENVGRTEVIAKSVNGSESSVVGFCRRDSSVSLWNNILATYLE